jgi:hypothetical protein
MLEDLTIGANFCQGIVEEKAELRMQNAECEDFTADFTARPAATKMNMEMTNGGWARPERSQGNDCQGNNPNEALFHSQTGDRGELYLF